MTDDDIHDLQTRLQAIVYASALGLADADYNQRVTWCRAHNQPNATLTLGDDGLIDIAWGGQPIAVVRLEDLISGVPLTGEPIGNDTPDTIPDEWQGEQ
jgi:hypothetical protein